MSFTINRDVRSASSQCKGDPDELPPMQPTNKPLEPADARARGNAIVPYRTRDELLGTAPK